MCVLGGRGVARNDEGGKFALKCISYGKSSLSQTHPPTLKEKFHSLFLYPSHVYEILSRLSNIPDKMVKSDNSQKHIKEQEENEIQEKISCLKVLREESEKIEKLASKRLFNWKGINKGFKENIHWSNLTSMSLANTLFSTPFIANNKNYL